MNSFKLCVLLMNMSRLNDCVEKINNYNCPLPTLYPSPVPTPLPSSIPTIIPSILPTQRPSPIPSKNPSYSPSYIPTPLPTIIPTLTPTNKPIRYTNHYNTIYRYNDTLLIILSLSSGFFFLLFLCIYVKKNRFENHIIEFQNNV